jgi:hypothetical protein
VAFIPITWAALFGSNGSVIRFMRNLRPVGFDKCFTVNVPICEDGGIRFTPKSGHVQRANSEHCDHFDWSH